MTAGGGRKGRRDAGRTLSRAPAGHHDKLSADRVRALSLTPVSRETAARLDRLVALLLTWQRRIKLIAPSTESIIWTRHIADSLQLLALARDACVWADLGSGGGFPGMAIACVLADFAGTRVHLVESNAKRSAFLREAARATGAPVIVHSMRIEDFAEHPPEAIEVVTARALAPLPELLSLAYPLLKKGARGLFPKGQDAKAELTEAAKSWKIQASLTLSRTDPAARILVVHGLEPKLRSAREVGF